MHNDQQLLLQLTRRELMRRGTMGLGTTALASLLAADLGLADESPTIGASGPYASRPSHFPPRAKNVIFLHMIGAPSQLTCLTTSQFCDRTTTSPALTICLRDSGLHFCEAIPG